MTVQRRLDRKARAAITAVILIFLAMIALMLRSCVVALTPQQTVATPDGGQDQLVILGKETVIVPRGSVGSKVVSWLNAGASGVGAFSVRDQAFAPRSDRPTAEGTAGLDRFAQMMSADRALTARVFVTAHDGATTSQNQELADMRARRIRNELVARGVAPSRITTAAMGGNQAPIVVVLSK